MRQDRWMCLAVALLWGTAAVAAPRPESSGFITGSNVFGQTGLLFTETAQTVGDGNASGTAHLTFGSGDDVDVLSVPVGFNVGLSPDFELAGHAEFQSVDAPWGDASGAGYLALNGKYVFPHRNADLPHFAASVEVAHGPLSDDLGDDGTDVTLKGLVSHWAPHQLLLNGGLGILVQGSRAGADNDTVLQLEGGLGYPLTPSLTGIAELALNRFGEDTGLVSFGLRGGRQAGLGWQALLGLGIGSASPDLTVGGGLRWGFGG
jgi:hypothetical protein